MPTALELLLVAHHAIEIAAHLLDRRSDRPALRRQRREQREKSLALAAGFVGLHDGAVEVRLLLGDGVLQALDLIGTSGIGGAMVDCGELAFELHADRIRGGLIRCRLSGLICYRRTENTLRGGRCGQSKHADQGAERRSAKAVHFLDHRGSRYRLRPSFSISPRMVA